jgi:hypothetical protein
LFRRDTINVLANVPKLHQRKWFANS